VCAQATLIDFILAQPARKASEEQTRAAGAQMLAALAHGHALGFAHRDVKARSNAAAAAVAPRTHVLRPVQA
jgi:hypothetical protein